MPKYMNVKNPLILQRKMKAKKRKNQYKTPMQYVNAVYKRNKDVIDVNIADYLVNLHGSPNKAFNAIVKEKMAEVNLKTGKNYTADEAIKSVSNSLDMMGAYKADGLTGTELRKAKISYIKGVNFHSLLKKDKEIYKEFRNRALRDRGRFTLYDPSKLIFLGYYKDGYGSFAAYQYGDTVIIERQSPKRDEQGNEVGASIELLDQGEFEMAIGKTIFEGK